MWGVMIKEHIKILFSMPHNIAPAEVIRRIRGSHFWARGFFWKLRHESISSN